MKKILSLFALIILLFLTSCSKANVSTRIAPTISRYNYLENYYNNEYIIVSLTNEESLKFKDYTKEDFKLDNIISFDEVTNTLLDNYYRIDLSNYYETQTMDNYRRRFRIYFDHSNCYDPFRQQIFDDADRLLKEVDFIESAKVIADTKNSFYEDRIFVTLTNEESLKFKEYTKEDFKLKSIEHVEMFTTENEVSAVKSSIGNERQDYIDRVNNFKIVLVLYMNYRDSKKIEEDIEWLINNVDIIESARSTFVKERVYYNDKIIVTFTEEESLKFKDNYTKEDFKIDGIKEVSMDELSLRYLNQYKDLYENGDDEEKKFVRSNFRNGVTLHMDYEDENRIVEDAKKLLDNVDIVNSVSNSEMPGHYDSLGVVFEINHEESMAFKEYTKEDFAPAIPESIIYDIVDLTYVYKEIIESNNTFFDAENFHRIILVILKYETVSIANNRFNEVSSLLDFVDSCSRYGGFLR